MELVTIGAQRASELVFALFEAKPWLTAPGVMTPEDAGAEAEAIAFLLRMAESGADEWGATGPAARRVANSLLVDFLAKLMHPESPFQNLSWSVPASEPAWRQALRVIAQEIRRSHGQPPTRH